MNPYLFAFSIEKETGATLLLDVLISSRFYLLGRTGHNCRWIKAFNDKEGFVHFPHIDEPPRRCMCSFL